MSIIFKMLKYLKNYSNLIASAIIIVLLVTLSLQAVSLGNYKSSYQEEVKLNSVVQAELNSVRKQSKNLSAQLAEQKQLIKNKNIKIQKLKKGVQKLKTEKQELKTSIEKFTTKTVTSVTSSKSNLNSVKVTTFKADGTYSQAAQVWKSLRNLGLNEYVCAGILGNIMAEVGGQTLDISRWSQYSHSSYYGICQWAGSRKQRLLNDFGTTLEDQIRFLSVELFEVIPKGNSFYNMQDEKEAALYFAKYYERCGSGSYYVRQTNATKALNYFT